MIVPANDEQQLGNKTNEEWKEGPPNAANQEPMGSSLVDPIIEP